MSVDITRIFKERLSRNRGLVPGDPDARHPAEYGVEAIIEGADILLTLGFLADVAYCCMEWSCHLSFPSQQRWNWLRQELSRSGVSSADQLSVSLTVVAERGAKFFDFSRPRPDLQHGWYDFSPQQAEFKHQTTIVESCDLD